MPLPLPNLDDRRWADLVDEGRALIPRYAPDWTDHNVHDPGITLIELFAWLTEMTVYRLNRVPARHHRKFLTLVGLNPEPPRAAQTVVTLNPDVGTDSFLLQAGAEFEATSPEGQPVRFRTLRDLTVAVIKLVAVQVEEIDAQGKRLINDYTRDWHDGLPIAALGRNPQPGSVLYLGFSELPSEVPIGLAFHFQGPGTGAEERERIVREADAQRAACRPVLPDIVCEEEGSEPQQPVETIPTHHSADVVWEVFTGGAPYPWTPLEPVTDLARPGVGQVTNDTRSLTLDGIVELNLPTTTLTMLGEVPENLFYVRCRLVAGAYDAPPILMHVTPNGVLAEQAVPVFQTFTIAAGVTPGGPAPSPGTTSRFKMQLDNTGVVQDLTFDPNAQDRPGVLVLRYEAPTVSAPGQITLELVLMGLGDGRPDQRGTPPQAPVQVESLCLYTHTEDGAWQEWTRRNDLDASGRTDFHFMLDATSGEITFGNGERGRVPPMDTPILAAYRATRAAEGNVAAGTVTRLADTPRTQLLPDDVRDQLANISVSNHVSATGGAEAETLAHATGRAVESLWAHERLLDLCAEKKCQTLDQVDRDRVQALRAPTRAVNLLDIERLALDVPGTQVARARAWAAHHASYPCLEAPGVVTVVVIPDMPVPRPDPSLGLLDAVRRYLDCRRIVTTRLEVVGPNYLEVRVSTRVRMRPHIDGARVEAVIRHALNAFFDPRTGGPNGRGWPFGRNVYRTEILQLIDGVPGVDHVLELSLKAGASEPQCGNLPVCPTWLVTPGRHQIEVV